MKIAYLLMAFMSAAVAFYMYRITGEDAPLIVVNIYAAAILIMGFVNHAN